MKTLMILIFATCILGYREFLRSDKFVFLPQKPGSNMTLTRFPLRIPMALQEHVRNSFQFPQKSVLDVNSIMKRSPRRRQGRQISPGVYSCGHSGDEMFINLINPHYPGPDNAAGTCHFRMTKNNPDICQVRIDFVDTELLTPNNGNCEDQYFSVSGTIWPIGVNKICGINPDQHFYVHFNDDRLTPNSNHIDIQITTSHSGKPYKFGIWLTQINCRENSIVQAPGGCTQYYFGKDGLIKTFNFEGVQYLAGQNYKMCIRAEQGACFVGFQAEVNHFMLQIHPEKDNDNFRSNRQSSRPPSGCGDSDCTFDWLLIPGARGNLTRYGLSRDRFCGGHLNIDSNEAESIPIYTEIGSQIIWLQLVTGLRDPHILENLASITGRKVTRNGFFGTSTYYNRNDLNEGYDGTGPGFRIRYTQLQNCLDNSFASVIVQ